MLFTTPTFILLFLPLALLGFYLLGRLSPMAAAGWLLAASLLFYSHWHPADTWLLLGSIAVNFLLGRQIALGRPGGRSWLMAGLVFNLGLLGYYKYAAFAVQNLSLVLGMPLPQPTAALPIGISFYSFTQIAFLVDTWQRKVHESQPVHYGLFVTYFPHLVAGPVLHHAQMMPQFADRSIYRVNGAQLVGGLAIFALGLFKKVVLADGVSPYADAVFKPVDGGATPDLAEAWLAALAYTCQLYFDFSGYSDMAIGLSWMFNVRLPFNFNSPYQAGNISDFWRRWHISLSTFLRDYLYIALGGNRHGAVRRYLNLATTMVLGGLWHGANWTFVLWGTLHGVYLMVHHGFRAALGESRHAALQRVAAWRGLAWVLTLLAVVVAWVLFRAETLGGAGRVLQGMVAGSVGQDAHPLLWNAGLHWHTGALWCAVLGAVALWAPNSNRIGDRLLWQLRERPQTRPLVGGAALVAVLGLLVVNSARDSVSAFIYFNF